ncbi:hypothetical protein BOTBODRAFT_65180 [Botryobasidium botryosum FD-172 SS1]|uniref:WW domain-containing protein n=1 Tax=Botryobasidium botryosum (strain FD-172 SS1) TaxID=930990 RepID=A0A067MJG4_BOTB1|nr:hypothetical protein BOTBODRAFT_65180 [Botryobasidium botryosum FD-172 SS1]
MHIILIARRPRARGRGFPPKTGDASGGTTCAAANIVATPARRCDAPGNVDSNAETASTSTSGIAALSVPFDIEAPPLLENDERDILLRPIASTSSSFVHVPLGWQKYIRPNGESYYHNRELQIVTTADVRQPDVLHQLQKCYEGSIPQEYKSASHLELCIRLHPSERVCVANITRRTYTLVSPPPPIQESASVIASLEDENEFWLHIERFPMHRSLPVAYEDELYTALAYQRTCHFMSVGFGDEPKSYSYAKDTAELLLQLFDGLKDRSDAVDGFKTWMIAASWLDILNMRIALHYGEAGVITTKRRPSTIPKAPFQHITRSILFLLFFNIPSKYAGRISGLHQGGMFYKDEWCSVMAEMLKEWSDTNLLASVVLSSSMALLAVPDIKSPAQAAGVLSVLCSVASLLIGIHNLWQHQGFADGGAREGSKYEENCIRRGDDPETSPTKLAIILSLPVSFLLWSVLALVIGVLYYAATETPVASKSLVGSVTGALLFLGIFSLWYFWETWQPESEPSVRQVSETGGASKAGV